MNINRLLDFLVSPLGVSLVFTAYIAFLLIYLDCSQ